jgi:nucleoid-associated protein YgaU
MRRPGQWVRALVSLVGMVALLAGVPWALIVWVGNPMPPEGLSWSAGLTDDALIGLLAVVVWVVWAQLVVCTAVAIVEEIRGVAFVSVPGVFGGQRDLARRAIAAMAVVVVSSTAAAGSAAAMAKTTHQPGKTTHSSTSAATRSAHTDSAGVVEAADVEAAGVEAADDARHAARDDLRLATVTQKESDLWTIAENHLGKGERWPEIRDLNQGRIMSDGRTFRSADLLMPGWRLLMPPDATGLPLAKEVEVPARIETVNYTVQPGDNLSTIAERFLGNAARYGEIFDLNAGKLQADGGRLTDPDQIWVGWTLEIPRDGEHRTEPPGEGRHADRTQPDSTEERPVQEPAERGPADEPERQPADRAPAEQPPADEPERQPAGRAPAEQPPADLPRHEATPPGGEAGPGPRAEPELTGNESSTDASDDDSAVPLVAVAGIGAVVAAGLVGLLRLRRTWQRAHRRPGQRVPTAVGATVALEDELTSGADLEGVELVDRALRSLSTSCRDGGNGGLLPMIQAARLTPAAVELYLAEAATLPEPWVALRGDTAWSLDRDAEGFAVFNDGGVAPYPALISLGTDPEGGEILVDLEFFGTLSLEGPPAETDRMLAALTTALATSQWADHLEVTIVGTHPELEGVLRTGRVKHLPEVGDLLNDLAVRAREDASAWSELEVRDVTEARVNQQPESAGLVVPEIVLLAAELTPEQRDQLANLLDGLPRVAVAAVTTGDAVGTWRLRPDPDSDDQRDWILEPVGLRLRPARLDDATFTRILELLRAADEEPEGAPAAVAEPASVRLPAQPAPGRHASDHVWPRPRGESTWRPSAWADTEDVVEVRTSRRTTPTPVIDNLGPPRIVNPAVEIPDNRLPRVLAFLCYLAENRGCSHERLDEAMFPGARVNPETRTRYINYARTLLGKGDDGMDYLPRRNYTDLSEDVVTTWDLFHNLVGDDPFSAPTDKLERALSLVRGRPYEGGKPAWYGWSERSARKMYDLIADTACALADRRFNDGQWRAAVDAAVLGWSIEPVQQWLWRVHIQGLRALGDVDEARRIAQERNTFSEELEFELEPETEQLFDELGIFGSTSITAAR